jgi:hypothetical protein
VRTLRPPRGGTPPPDTAILPGGTTVFLAPLAHEVARRYGEEFPDEEERYGAAWFAWCVHDVQYILGWAAQDASGSTPVLERQLTWLAAVLEAREFPLERLVRSLELCADALPGGAERVRKRLLAARSVVRARIDARPA